MKSIHEASVAYGREHQGTVNIEDFEAGANYALGQIEKLIDNQNWCAFPKQSYKELKELIEQLKK